MKISEDDPIVELAQAFRRFIRAELAAVVDERIPKHLAQLRLPPQPAPAERRAPNDYLTFDEAAEIARCSKSTIKRRVAAGELRACGPRRNRIARFELDRMMDAGRPRPTAIDPTNATDADITRLADELLDDDDEDSR